eukprot:8687866-Pyramimonas_sp.AAC.1
MRRGSNETRLFKLPVCLTCPNDTGANAPVITVWSAAALNLHGEWHNHMNVWISSLYAPHSEELPVMPRSVRRVCQNGCGRRMRTQPRGPSVGLSNAVG